MRGFFMAEKAKKLPDSRKQRYAALPAGNFGQIMLFLCACRTAAQSTAAKKTFCRQKKSVPEGTLFY